MQISKPSVHTGHITGPTAGILKLFIITLVLLVFTQPVNTI